MLQGPEDHLSVMLARADGLRHQLPSPANPSSPPAVKLRAWFAHCTTTLAQLFPEYLDRSLRLPAYWAAVEGVVLGDLAAMRTVWEETVKGKEGRWVVGNCMLLLSIFTVGLTGHLHCASLQASHPPQRPSYPAATCCDVDAPRKPPAAAIYLRQVL